MKILKKTYILISLLLLSSCIETLALGTAGSVYYLSKKKNYKESIEDIRISSKIKNKIKEEKPFAAKKIKIRTYKSRVLLLGQSNSKKYIEEIVKKSWQTKNVKEVMNEIVFDEKDQANTVKDKLLKTLIKTEILLKKEINSADIIIEIYDGVAFLLGEQDSKKQVNMVNNLVAKTQGIKKVVSFIRYEG